MKNLNHHRRRAVRSLFMGKAYVIMRDQTKWMELIEVGANELVGADKYKIIDAINRNLGREVESENTLNGGAAKRVAEKLKEIIS